jgi:hypothetical protein
VRGGSGNDILLGQAGDDRLEGGSGCDISAEDVRADPSKVFQVS